MGQEPGAIRDEIEQTRERMGDTVEALTHKADVKGRAKESVSEKVDSLKAKVGVATDRVGGAAGSVNEATPSSDDVKDGARRAAGVAQENPLGLAIGAVAIGFVGGLLVPATRVENEKIGEVADQVKDQVRETAQTAVDHGKQAAQDAAQAAAGAAKEAGQEHVEQAKSDIGEQAQQAREQVGSSS